MSGILAGVENLSFVCLHGKLLETEMRDGEGDVGELLFFLYRWRFVTMYGEGQGEKR